MGVGETKMLWTAIELVFAAIVIIGAIVVGLAVWKLVVDDNAQNQHLAQRIDLLMCGNSVAGECPSNRSAYTLFPLAGDEEYVLLVFGDAEDNIAYTDTRWRNSEETIINPCDAACVCTVKRKRNATKSDCYPLAQKTIEARRDTADAGNESTKTKVEITGRDVIIPYQTGQRHALESEKDLWVTILYIEYEPGTPPKLLITPYYNDTHGPRMERLTQTV